MNRAALENARREKAILDHAKQAAKQSGITTPWDRLTEETRELKIASARQKFNERERMERAYKEYISSDGYLNDAVKLYIDSHSPEQHAAELQRLNSLCDTVYIPNPAKVILKLDSACKPYDLCASFGDVTTEAIPSACPNNAWCTALHPKQHTRLQKLRRKLNLLGSDEHHSHLRLLECPGFGDCCPVALMVSVKGGPSGSAVGYEAMTPRELRTEVCKYLRSQRGDPYLLNWFQSESLNNYGDVNTHDGIRSVQRHFDLHVDELDKDGTYGDTLFLCGAAVVLKREVHVLPVEHNCVHKVIPRFKKVNGVDVALRPSILVVLEDRHYEPTVV